MKLNSPDKSSDVATKFIKNIARCTITEVNKKEPYNPNQPNPKNPFVDVPGTDQPVDVILPPDDGDGGDADLTPTYAVTSNRASCPEGEFIIYTVSTTNFDN